MHHYLYLWVWLALSHVFRNPNYDSALLGLALDSWSRSSSLNGGRGGQWVVDDSELDIRIAALRDQTTTEWQ